jgi:hypothetical protein
MPLVILIDGATAGASEGLAGLLMERGRGLLVGTKTAGWGAVGDTFDMAYELGSVSLTTAHVETAGGRQFDGKGVSPDVLLEFRPKGAGSSGSTDSVASITLPPTSDPFVPIRFAQAVLMTASGGDRKALLEATRKLSGTRWDLASQGVEITACQVESRMCPIALATHLP